MIYLQIKYNWNLLEQRMPPVFLWDLYRHFDRLPYLLILQKLPDFLKKLSWNPRYMTLKIEFSLKIGYSPQCPRLKYKFIITKMKKEAKYYPLTLKKYLEPVQFSLFFFFFLQKYYINYDINVTAQQSSSTEKQIFSIRGLWCF